MPDTMKSFPEEQEAASGNAAFDKAQAGLETQDGTSDQDAPCDPELQARQEAEAEQEALAYVFADIRRQSADSQLVVPVRWVELEIIPSHLSGEEFEMLIYDVLEQAHEAASTSEADEEAEKQVFRSAERAVGVPRPINAAETAAPEDGQAAEGVGAAAGPAPQTTAPPEGATDPTVAGPPTETTEPDRPSDHDSEALHTAQEAALDFEIPDGYELIELEGELVLVPREDQDTTKTPLACDDIIALVGKRSYYLYSRAYMTDAYAHWAFLAHEDDRIVTFVDCVREESRLYPRPMAAKSLSNEPFNMSAEEVSEIWEAIRSSDEYIDIGQVTASNGEVFYYSDEFLSRPYAQSLAEWHAVEREMNL